METITAHHPWKRQKYGKGDRRGARVSKARVRKEAVEMAGVSKAVRVRAVEKAAVEKAAVAASGKRAKHHCTVCE
jgi:hypothetical protein